MILACLSGSDMEVVFFKRVSDAIRFIMKQKGHSVINYIDDLIGYALPNQADQAFQDLCNTLQELGFDLSSTKLVPPA